MGGLVMISNGLWMGAALIALALGTEGQTNMTQRASGAFEVTVTPVAADGQRVASAQMSLAKSFSGDLTGSSQGAMWTTDAAVEGSGGYVAIEKVEGTLRGRSGSFTLIHQGTMRRGGDYQMRIVVVPDSGTGQLIGLSGAMTIRIEKGAHFYDLDYTLPESQ